jgi:Reverse transcriptase (RNA-dependent DNA polymerase)
MAILSAVQYLEQKRRPGFLVSLDLFHAYDCVDLRWVDRVMEAIGFGRNFRGWIQTLHRQASACFMLHSLSPFLLILFSIRQGDPLAMLLFILMIEPLLRRLQRDLAGLHVGRAKVAGLGYVDDVATVNSNPDEDLPALDSAVKDFEAASGAILNRNQKSVIVGLGEWAGRQEWPLPWLHVAPHAKVYGFVFAASVADILCLFWDRVVSGLKATLALWRGRHLPTLLTRRLALETYALSRLWYFAQLLPTPTPLSCAGSGPPLANFCGPPGWSALLWMSSIPHSTMVASAFRVWPPGPKLFSSSWPVTSWRPEASLGFIWPIGWASPSTLVSLLWVLALTQKLSHPSSSPLGYHRWRLLTSTV